eukprot:NODE_35741_length_252_cov_4.712000.p3 GENE.NODE_35741_length_252_cov_4.712000~~NODE_35741_length_252_cov_4.712000.p3  ORF type:complete len:76 (-),score=18.97 NODE_35741_length_252_cov_4.712000:25-252(-)
MKTVARLKLNLLRRAFCPLLLQTILPVVFVVLITVLIYVPWLVIGAGLPALCAGAAGRRMPRPILNHQLLAEGAK